MGRPEPGDPAPDFELSNQFGERIRLSALRSTPVAIVFFPFAFSRICTGELCELQENLRLFEDHRVTLFGVSVDHKYSLRAYADVENLGFDLLADFWPHGEVARRYGIFDEDSGFAERSTFVLNGSGHVSAVIRSEMGRPRSLADYRSALERLAAGARP